MSGHVTWTPERTELLRSSWANGISRNDAALLLNVTPKALAEKVKNLGIQRRRIESDPEPLPEPSIPCTVRHQAVTDYHGGWNYREQCFDNNHLYREAISLAAVW